MLRAFLVKRPAERDRGAELITDRDGAATAATASARWRLHIVAVAGGRLVERLINVLAASRLIGPADERSPSVSHPNTARH